MILRYFSSAKSLCTARSTFYFTLHRKILKYFRKTREWSSFDIS